MTPTPISEILSGDDLDRFAAHHRISRGIIPLAPGDHQPPFAPTGFKYESDADVRARLLAKIRPAPAPTDGTTFGEARAIVAAWQEAHDLPFLSPEACRDLAARIEAAMIAERAEP